MNEVIISFFSFIYKWSYTHYRSAVKRHLARDRARIGAPVVITEHALLRYAERVKGFDIKAAAAEMMGENLKKRVETLGNGDYPMNGYTLRVLNKAVVTVLDKRRSWRSVKNVKML